MEKQVILLNGPSSSGKSTLARALRAHIKAKRHEEFGIVSIDDFMKVAKDETIYEDDVYEISPALCGEAARILKTAQGLIIDHVITSERIFLQLKEALRPYRLYTVRVSCPLEVLRERERARGDRCPGSAEASEIYLYPKEGYDLRVDTHLLPAAEAAEEIARLLD